MKFTHVIKNDWRYHFPDIMKMTSKGHRKRHKYSSFDVITWLFVLLLAWIPFPLGANRPLPEAFAGVYLAVLLFAWVVFALYRKPEVRLPGQIVVAAWLVGVVVAWSWIQAQSWTPQAWHHAIWKIFDGLDDGEVSGRISINAYSPYGAIFGLGIPVAAFALAYVLAARKHRANFILGSILVISVGYALAGILFNLTGWVPFAELKTSKEISSTFVNRNHYAMFANLGLCIALTWVLMPLFQAQSERLPLRAVLIRAVVEPFERRPRVTAAAGVIMAALIGTFSRGGFLSLFAAIIVVVFVGIAGTRLSLRRATQVLIGSFALMIVVMYFIGGPLLERFNDIGNATDLTTGARLSAWKRTIELVEQRPWLGYGNGSYLDLFMMNNDLRFKTVFDHAHNDYLELIAELGLVGAGALIAALGILVGFVGRGALVSRGDGRAIALTGVAAGTVAGVHSIFDFGLAIPAVAVTFATILGVGCSDIAHRSTEAGP
ncbi:MAG: O-antigen ligase family protein [Geminicoccaceae bacterium]|nr:O-antigen ligase family protein [Geminicoccaceae bacterium]